LRNDYQRKMGSESYREKGNLQDVKMAYFGGRILIRR
jgi:hypothetical protein